MNFTKEYDLRIQDSKLSKKNRAMEKWDIESSTKKRSSLWCLHNAWHYLLLIYCIGKNTDVNMHDMDNIKLILSFQISAFFSPSTLVVAALSLYSSQFLLKQKTSL